MKIKSKEDFILLYLLAMSHMGFVVFTCDFKEDLLKMMRDRKYDDLFSFFHSLEDLDFSRKLGDFVQNRWIEVSSYEKGTTIHLLPSFSYSDSTDLTNRFDFPTLSLMMQLLNEMNLNAALTGFISEDVDASYRLANPNTVYTIDDTMSIVTDGEVEPLNKDNTYLVQNASFVVLQKKRENKLVSFDLFYPFDDQQYIFHIVKKILNLSKDVTEHMKLFPPRLEEKNQQFEQLEGINGFRYKY